jgi:hypothetical protein
MEKTYEWIYGEITKGRTEKTRPVLAKA